MRRLRRSKKKRPQEASPEAVKMVRKPLHLLLRALLGRLVPRAASLIATSLVGCFRHVFGKGRACEGNSTLRTECQSPFRIALRQGHSGTARQQRLARCCVKPRRRRTGLLAGESFEHWFRQRIGIVGDWRLQPPPQSARCHIPAAACSSSVRTCEECP